MPSQSDLKTLADEMHNTLVSLEELKWTIGDIKYKSTGIDIENMCTLMRLELQKLQIKINELS